MDVIFIIAYFNPIGYKKIKENLLSVVAHLEGNGRSYIVGEVIQAGESSDLTGLTNHVVTESCGPMFYKESIWNWLAPIVSADFSHLVFLDADVMIDDMDSFDSRLSGSLSSCEIAQLFDTAYYLDRFENRISARNSVGWALKNSKSNATDPRVFHAGFGFALKSETFSDLGVFFPCVVGEGDVLAVSTITRNTRDAKSRLLAISYDYLNYFESWEKEKKRWAHLKLGSLEGTVSHLYHGPLVNRQYDSRLIAWSGFRPSEHLVLGCGTSIPSFNMDSDTAREVRGRVRSYFIERRDDE